MKTAKKTFVLSRLHVLTLQFLVSFPVVIALALTPALPLLTKDFGISSKKAQLMISIYLIGFTFGHLFYGPLANRFGRKRVLISCLSISALSSIGCIIAGSLHSFSSILVFRLIMALAASGTLKLSYTYAADSFKGPLLTRISSYFIISFAVAPPLGIFISGFLVQEWGYISTFLFILIYSLLLLLLTLFLPETLKKKDLSALKPLSIGKKYLLSAQQPILIVSSLILGAAIASTYLFGSEIPFIGEDLIGLSPAEFGTMALVTYLGMLLGGILCSIVAKSISRQLLLVCGALITIASSLALTLFFFFQYITSLTLFVTLAGVFFGIALVCSNIISIALNYAKDKSYGSATLNFISTGISVIAVFLVAKLSQISILSFPLTLLALGIAEIILIAWIRQLTRKPHENS